MSDGSVFGTQGLQSGTSFVPHNSRNRARPTPTIMGTAFSTETLELRLESNGSLSGRFLKECRATHVCCDTLLLRQQSRGRSCSSWLMDAARGRKRRQAKLES